MANVDPFIQPIPSRFQQDPETRAYIEYLHRFLHDLWARTGGGEDIINNTIVEEKYAWDLSVNFAREQGLSLPQVDYTQEQPLVLPQTYHIEKVFNAVTTTTNYTAVDYDFVNAKNGCTVTLPEYPEENAVVIIRNGDGTLIKLSGNGRLINSESTGRIYRKGTSLALQYFIDDNEWFAR